MRARAIVVGLLAAIVVLPPAAAAEKLHHHGHSFSPQVGDWEGVVRGMHASFQLGRSAKGRLYGAAGFAVSDLVEQSFTTCPTDPVAFGEAIEGLLPAPLYVGRSGSFPFGFKTQGAFTGARRARLSTTFKTFSAGGTTCQGTLNWSMRPEKRRPVADGRWRLSLADGSRQTISLEAGGRLAPGISIPSVRAVCNGVESGAVFGDVDLFVPANGRADQLVSDSGGMTLRLAMTFTDATHARGEWTADEPGCTPGTMRFTAARTGA